MTMWAGPKHTRKNLRAMLSTFDTVRTQTEVKTQHAALVWSGISKAKSDSMANWVRKLTVQVLWDEAKAKWKPVGLHELVMPDQVRRRARHVRDAWLIAACLRCAACCHALAGHGAGQVRTRRWSRPAATLGER